MSFQPETSASDEDLLRAWIDGDNNAMGELINRHEKRVYGIAYRILGNREDALDATQDAFLTVIRKARSFKYRSAFTTWLHRLTFNAATDLYRKRSRTRTEGLSDEAGASDPSAEATDRVAVEKALEQLPIDQRTSVVMRDIYGMTYEEIAEISQVKVGTVKSRIARARSALAEVLGEQTGPPARLTDKNP